MTRRETEALSPGFEGGDGQKRIRWREGLLRVYSVPSHLILYQPSRGCRVSLRGSAITERAQRLERKSGWPRLGGRDARDDA